MGVPWIKITTNIFDDDKIKLIDAMPDHDALLVVWFKLLTLAGRCNSAGCLYIAENMPYTDEMLAAVFSRPLPTVRIALDTLEKCGKIKISEGIITVYPQYHREGRNRECREYKQWRVDVFRRDDYTCKICGERGGKLVAHHIKPWAKYIDLRFDIGNGMTVCYDCHRSIHKKGK